MNKNILVIIDDSGSMADLIKTVSEKCLDLVRQHQDANFIFWKFGSYDVVEKISLGEVRNLSASSGMTALYKAVTVAIEDLGELYNSNKLQAGKTIVFILTDGDDNQSREYTKEGLDEIMKHQTEKYGWEFHYFGSSPKQNAVSQKMNYSSTRGFEASVKGVGDVFLTMSKSIS